MLRSTLIIILALALTTHLIRAEAPASADDPLVRIDEGHVYRVVNGADITGREVLDVLVEDAWDKYISAFIEFAIRNEEVEKSKVQISDEEIRDEMALLLKTQGRNLVKADEIEKEFGSGVYQALKRTVRVDIGLLKIFQMEKRIDEKLRTVSPEYQRLKKNFIEGRVKAAGVITTPKELGGGEAVRIGPKGYARDEVRKYIIEAEGQIRKSDLSVTLEQLKLEKLVNAEAARLKVALNDNGRNFHFSYLCRLKEREMGVPGIAIMRQIMQQHGMTAEQYMHSRIFSFDALATWIVFQNIKEKQVRAEFALKPDKYKLSENLTAHIFVQVLDPDGHPYGPNWRAPGHGAINTYVERRRNEQFEAAKSKIDGLYKLALENFGDTARKHSDDQNKKADGLIGRLGPNTIPSRPIDKSVLDAASKLKPGEISTPVRSDYGWHILKCLDKQDVTYEEVEERVYMNLIYEARKDLFERLLKTAKVEDKF